MCDGDEGDEDEGEEREEVVMVIPTHDVAGRSRIDGLEPSYDAATGRIR